MAKISTLFSDAVYSFKELNKLRKFKRMIFSGVEKCEPRFREITTLSPPALPGTVEYAHVMRYQFAATMLQTGRTLNVACGSGYGNAILANAGHHPVGVDLYERPLELARRNFPFGEYLCADAQDLIQIETSSFDSVVSFETIEHVRNPTKACSEFKRVLRTGGKFVGSIPVMIFHNPGTNFTWESANEFIQNNFKGSTLYLQNNQTISPASLELWRTIRNDSDKYILWVWQK